MNRAALAERPEIGRLFREAFRFPTPFDESSPLNPSTTSDELVRLFQSRYDLIVRIAQRYAPNAEMARDITQEVFWEFVREAKGRNWDLQRDINPLLHGITKNIARRVWSREKKHLPKAMLIVAERYLKKSTTDSDRHMEERIDQLNRCIEKLTPRARRFIESHYFGGATMEEIAKEKGMKADTVRQMFCRWRSLLRNCMERVSR